uniref:ribosome-recycling factor, mitochondrial isoform X1 n=1 Tax=Myxine glutinosa TaxID=7769 RepID=UPI00358E8893
MAALWHRTFRLCQLSVLPGRQLLIFTDGSYGSTAVALQVRHMAKKGKGRTSRVTVREDLLSDVLDMQDVRAKMKEVLDRLREEFVHSLSLRSSTGVVDRLPVTLGQETVPLNQLGVVTLMKPHLLTINLGSNPEAKSAVLEALTASGMNLNPQSMGSTIQVPIPRVSREQREALSRKARQVTNEAKQGLREVRSHAITSVRKVEGVSKDTLHLVEKQVDQLAGDYSVQADKLLEAKTNELLQNN